MKPLGVGIVGAGGIGARRAQVAREHHATHVVAVHDRVPERAAALATATGAAVAASEQDVVVHPGVDIVVVATTHEALAPVSLAAARAGRHVLCEKPMARHPDELRPVVEAARQAGTVLKGGYNHRYHPAVARLHQACASGAIGTLLNVRARYGHGGRPGYEREWRADPGRAGGGELLDQGCHLVDLFLWLLGDFAEVCGYVDTQFWDMAVEDNAFGLFRTAAGQVACMHVSWTQWRNLFSLEVHGRDGYASAAGLGRSYGTECFTLGRRPPRGGRPQETCEYFPGPDLSWQLEWEDLVRAIQHHTTPSAAGATGLHTLEWIHRLYAAAAAGRPIPASMQP